MAGAKKDEYVGIKLALVLIVVTTLLSGGKDGHIPWPMLVSLGMMLITVLAVPVTLWYLKRCQRRLLDLAGVDTMSGVDFERYTAWLLKSRGYRVDLTPQSGDQGADIIASKAGISWAVQCKRRTQMVSRTAISDAVGAMKHYRCQRAMVITNNLFTKGAVSLAKSNDCVLIDRNDLAQWISELQSGKAA